MVYCSNCAYEVEFTEEYIEEMTKVYEYISEHLKNKKAANILINKINERILNLPTDRNIYRKIEKVDRLKREYHRMVINNFIVLYTVDSNKRKIYVSRLMYKRRKYLN